MTRPSINEYFMDMAKLVASRGTCCRRKVGAVLVDNRNHVLSTGYNGVASGLDHCEGDTKCSGANLPSGQGLDKCEAIHAEQNALLQCSDVYKIQTLYCTASPCVTCVKLLLNTSCWVIVFNEEYPHGEAKKLWESAGRQWVNYSHLHEIKLSPKRRKYD